MNFIMLNLSKPPFDNLKVRQAMAMAVSSAQYAQVIDKRVNPHLDQPFVPGTPYYVTDRVPRPQPEQGQGSWSSRSTGDGQAGQPSPSTTSPTPAPRRSPSTSRRSSRRWG